MHHLDAQCIIPLPAHSSPHHIARRFNFDWDAKEDTYEARLHEGSLLFGRGQRAGMDARAQRESAARSEATYLNEARRARGQLTSAADLAADTSRAERAGLVDEDPASRFRAPVLLWILGCDFGGCSIFQTGLCNSGSRWARAAQRLRHGHLMRRGAHTCSQHMAHVCVQA